MSEAAKPGSKFVYVTYIRTTPQKLWDALTKPEFTRVYWFDMWQDSDFKEGSSWKLIYPDGRIADQGTIVSSERPKRLVISWQNEWKPEMKAEGVSRATFEIEPAGETVKLTVIHEIPVEGSKLIEAVSGGWPLILSGLKSLLETGEKLRIPHPRKAEA
ncbi:MAG TPA: SRPBCC family protein [Stellaceae bacterium]|nr:SRPBCC family protein [Stellaceae bacterium]